MKINKGRRLSLLALSLVCCFGIAFKDTKAEGDSSSGNTPIPQIAYQSASDGYIENNKYLNVSKSFIDVSLTKEGYWTSKPKNSSPNAVFELGKDIKKEDKSAEFYREKENSPDGLSNLLQCKTNWGGYGEKYQMYFLGLQEDGTATIAVRIQKWNSEPYKGVALRYNTYILESEYIEDFDKESSWIIDKYGRLERPRADLICKQFGSETEARITANYLPDIWTDFVTFKISPRGQTGISLVRWNSGKGDFTIGERKSSGAWITKKANDPVESCSCFMFNISGIPESTSYNLDFDSNKPFNATHDVTGNMENIKEVGMTSLFKLPANEYSLTGWKMIGWSRNKSSNTPEFKNEETISKLASGDKETVVLYAVWEPNTYTVKYLPGPAGDKNQPYEKVHTVNCFYDREYEYLQNKNSPADNNTAFVAKTLEGYNVVWTGWNNGTKNINMTEKIQNYSNLTDKDKDVVELKGVWQYVPKKYRVNYNSNFVNSTGETIGYDADNNKLINMDEFVWETPKRLAVNGFEAKGYTFKYWSTLPNGKGKIYHEKETVTSFGSKCEDINLYAIWEPNKYLIEYDANGGEGKMSPQKMVYDEITKLSPNAFRKKGYEFSGWSLKNSSSVIDFSNEQAVKNLSANAKTVTLYAVWEPKKYTIIFNSNTGENKMENQMAEIDEVAILNKNVFSKKGFKFVGWTLEKNGSGNVYKDMASVVNLSNYKDVVTLYAKWKPVKNVVNFNKNYACDEKC